METHDHEKLRATAVALSREPSGAAGWSYAPLKTSAEIVGYFVEEKLQRVVPLPAGETLLAGWQALWKHEFPGRWFGAGWAMVSLEAGIARISDARATNTAIVNGVELRLANWNAVADASLRMRSLVPEWRELNDGDSIRSPWPEATWIFLWVSPRST